MWSFFFFFFILSAICQSVWAADFYTNNWILCKQVFQLRPFCCARSSLCCNRCLYRSSSASPRPQTTREEFVSVWSNGYICQERHGAMTRRGGKCVYLCRESVSLEPPPRSLCCYQIRWLRRVSFYVHLCVHNIYPHPQHACVCKVFVAMTVHVSHYASGEKKRLKLARTLSHMPQALTHCTTMLWLPPPPVSVWQGDVLRMRGKSASPGCCAVANPDFMQCDTEEDTGSCAPFRAELSELRRPGEQIRFKLHSCSRRDRAKVHFTYPNKWFYVKVWHIIFLFSLAWAS